MSIHLIKLVVGVDTLADFFDVQNTYAVEYNGRMVHGMWTRHKPKREAELLEHGSAYRVIKNRIICRQKIIGFEDVTDTPKGKMCLVLMEPEIIRTAAAPHRPFQGWRYLKPSDAPPDIGIYSGTDDNGNGDETIAEDLSALGLL